jgi:putative membrane protein
MEFLKFSLSGFDDFLLYFGLSIGFVVLYLAIYVRATPYREFALIRAGNAAAAASLSGSLIGFVLPLASAVVHSVNPWDMALWAAIALAVQIVVHLAVRLLLPDVVVRQIPEGKVSAGVLLGAVSLAAGILNAACMTPPA